MPGNAPRCRPPAPYRTRYDWGYLASALEIGGKDEAHFVFLPCMSKAASASFLQALADTDPQCIHVVIQDHAGFHLQPQDEGVMPNVRLLSLPPNHTGH